MIITTFIFIFQNNACWYFYYKHWIVLVRCFWICQFVIDQIVQSGNMRAPLSKNVIKITLSMEISKEGKLRFDVKNIFADSCIFPSIIQITYFQNCYHNVTLFLLRFKYDFCWNAKYCWNELFGILKYYIIRHCIQIWLLI